jgi:hypothetical protein
MGDRSGSWFSVLVSCDIRFSKENLTSSAGLQLLVEAFDGSFLKEKFSECLPTRVSPRSKGSYRLGLIQVASFLKGHDCIEDLEKFREDPSVTALMQGESVASRTMLDFLKDFEPEHIQRLNGFLSVQAKATSVQLELPQIELGRFYWKPSWSETLLLPVVVKRTRATRTRPGRVQLLRRRYQSPAH